MKSISNSHELAYTPITDDPVVLDLTGCQGWGDLQQRIKKQSLWDCFF